jgi:diguanylate cyclase (GGDEF)-like protein
MGLSNRRGFTMVARHVLALCRRNRQGAVVVAFDLDHFKSINDQHGHEAGDDVLRRFAKQLYSHFRTSDVVARFGGDEFSVLCSGASHEQVMESVQRLKCEFDESALAKTYPALSWSAGLAAFDPRSDQSIDELLRMSDARMHCAKAEGRRPAEARPRLDDFECDRGGLAAADAQRGNSALQSTFPERM